jgi:predicted mannosyl-3-phosphoglycerate phosphatase (HAD superfamily)
MTPILVLSDVDGVLNDPKPASLARAASALMPIADDRCALVLCSRYTRAELEILQQKLGINQPFVAENGAAVFIPAGHFGVPIPGSRRQGGYDVVEFARPLAEVLSAVREVCLRLDLDLRGFSEMTVDEVARARGISPLRGRLAKLCEYMEPCRPAYSEQVTRGQLARALEPKGLSILRRGQDEFVGEALAPGIAVTFVRSLYRHRFGSLRTFGLADGMADDTLLSGTDHRVIVQDDDGGVDVSAWAESIAEMVREEPVGSGIRN